MRLSVKIIVLLLIFSTTYWTQAKKFTIEDVVINSKTTLTPTTLKNLQWIPNEYAYSYLTNIEKDDVLVKGMATSGQISVIISLSELTNLISDYSNITINEFPKIDWLDEFNFQFHTSDKVFNYNLEDEDLNVIASLPSKSENVYASPNGKVVAFTRNNNIYISKDDDENIQVTNDDGYNITNGVVCSRKCFGIDKGIFWSPKSNFVAFYREDLTNITDYPLVDITTTPASLKNIKYPMAGQNSAEVKLGVYDVKNNKTIWIQTNEGNNQYLTSVTWDPTEKYIYIALLNRDQNHLRLAKYEVQSGALVKVLFEEKSEKYVEPENPLHFLPDDSTKFIWFSERDGWNHLYLYSTEGELIKQLTSGKWVVTEYLGVDSKYEDVFIVGTKDSPIERHLYRINIRDNRFPKKLTADIGIHDIMMHNSRRYYIDKFSSLTFPNKISVFTDKGEGIGLLHNAENPLQDYDIGDTEIFTIKASDDSTELYCRMVYPPNFDTSKTYPVIVYVYGGPHSQLVTNKWSSGKYAFWFNYMAQHDYIILTVDNRGTSNRGLEYEQATFRNLGTIEIEDQLRGIEYLKTKSFIDLDRIGVYGWSYGGFMATSLMTRTDNIYKVGVAGGAVIDWVYYEIMYTERYMDTPETNYEGYSKANLINYIANLQGKLLLLHGTLDPIVVWQHTLQYAKKAAENNIPLDYYPYPGHEHHVLDKDIIHLYNKISNYFLDNL